MEQTQTGVVSLALLDSIQTEGWVCIPRILRPSVAQLFQRMLHEVEYIVCVACGSGEVAVEVI